MHNLEEKAALLDLLFEATNDGVVDWDIAGGRTQYNERWRFLLGWDEQGFVLTPDTWRELVHADERASLEQAIADHLEQEWPFVQTVRMRHRSMGWRWILMRGSSRRDAHGKPSRMVIIFADVDERVRAESQVRALVEAIPDAIVRVTADGTVLTAKDGPRLDSAAEPGMGCHGLFEAIRDSEVGPEVMRAIAGARGRGDVAQIPCRMRNANREPVDYDIRVVHSGSDEAVCIVRDVTRERSAQEQLARGKKLEAIGQLAAGLAHEINTPLQYIGDNLQFAKDAIPALLLLIDAYRDLLAQPAGPSAAMLAALAQKEEDADLAYLRGSLGRALDTGLDGLAHIARIVHAMRTFEDVGRQARARMELNPIVENATVVSTHTWKRVADLALHLAPDLPFVPCIAGEIAQVVLNLVINAAQAVADKVAGSGLRGHITVETLHDRVSRSVELRVSDDGVGIPEAIRGKIFDPFFTTRPVGQGSGQGLAQVHAAVVGLHGGRIRVDSVVGQGTLFVISLPLDDVEDPPPGAGGNSP